MWVLVEINGFIVDGRGGLVQNSAEMLSPSFEDVVLVSMQGGSVGTEKRNYS
jgi:hypothetical protein